MYSKDICTCDILYTHIEVFTWHLHRESSHRSYLQLPDVDGVTFISLVVHTLQGSNSQCNCEYGKVFPLNKMFNKPLLQLFTCQIHMTQH